MRRSLGGANGGMLRTVQRATGVSGESFSQTPTTPSSKPTKASSSSGKTTTPKTLLITSNTSTPFSKNPINLPVSWNFSSSSSSSVGDEFDEQWECVDHGMFQEIEAVGFDYEDDHCVFGSVPSLDEVQHAVSSLQQVLEPTSYAQFIKDRAAYDSEKDVANHMYSPINLIRKIPSVGSKVDWMEPSLQPWNSNFSKPQESDGVSNALYLLQTEPAVQRMVVALSSDKAVWDAVMNNEMVRELRNAFDEVDKDDHLDEGSDDPEAAENILSWLLTNTKAKCIILFDKMTGVVNKLFLPPEGEKPKKDTGIFEDKLRTSLLLSIMVLLVVVVSRASRVC